MIDKKCRNDFDLKKSPSRRAIYLTLPLLISFIGSVILLNYLAPDNAESKVNYEELALGVNTSVYKLKDSNTQIHCHDLKDFSECIDSYYKKAKDTGIYEDVVLWLGNSQLHSINQMKFGDETSTPILHRNITDQKKYLMTFSQPNASLQEHYVLFNFLANKVPLSTLILPIVFDDMRETGLRKSLTGATKETYVVESLKKTSIGKKILTNHSDKDMAGNKKMALEGTLQENVEFILNTKLGLFWNTWSERPALRGSFLYGVLYKFRNWLFDINPSSIRKVIPGRYLMNMQALNEILITAQEKNIYIFLYIAPIRNDIHIPYDLVEYDNFKEEVRNIASRYNNVAFENLEDLVPAVFWGSKASTSIDVSADEVDFMHFQAGGHKILAKTILDKLRSIWN